MTQSKHLFLLIAFLFFHGVDAQEKKDSLALRFHLKFENAAIIPNQKYVSAKNDTLQIETLRFYIFDIQIDFADNTILNSDVAHLIDLDIPASQNIALGLYAKKEIKQITFSLGIDSLANVSGALSGDLDPSKGMYWAWQSGYINMKIEGRSLSCKTRKNQFHFHIGGYLQPYNAIRNVVLYPQRKPTIDIVVDAAQFFSEVGLSQTNNIMIPGKQAIQLADLATKMFKIENEN